MNKKFSALAAGVKKALIPTLVLSTSTAAYAADQQPDKKKAKQAPANYDRTLFTRLKHLRKVLAEENEVPPYVVFSDATLVDMACKLPTTRNTLLDVSGVGQTKLERYGEAFIQLIDDYINREH